MTIAYRNTESLAVGVVSSCVLWIPGIAHVHHNKPVLAIGNIDVVAAHCHSVGKPFGVVPS